MWSLETILFSFQTGCFPLCLNASLSEVWKKGKLVLQDRDQTCKNIKHRRQTNMFIFDLFSRDTTDWFKKRTAEENVCFLTGVYFQLWTPPCHLKHIRLMSMRVESLESSLTQRAEWHLCHLLTSPMTFHQLPPQPAPSSLMKTNNFIPLIKTGTRLPL